MSWAPAPPFRLRCCYSGAAARGAELGTAGAETLAVIALVAVLAWAVIRPRGWPEVVAAVPAAVLVIAADAIPLHDAGAEAGQLGPVIGFLAAVLVIAQLCADEGLFRACGAWMARRSGGRPRRLLVQVFAVAAVTTAVLSLDATVVLLTPVVFVTAARLRVRSQPYMYACTHLANSASLLLPVSNLTNLLAFSASGLSFGRFAGLMALPWLAAIGVEYVVLSLFFRGDLTSRPPAHGAARGQESSQVRDEGAALPVFTIVVVALTLAGFAVASAAGVNPAWAALAGAVVLAARGLAQRRTGLVGLARAADVPFLVFVLCLGIVVRAVVDNGLSRALHPLLPSGTSWPALLAVAAVAAVLANLINNLPAVLVLLPLAAPSGAGAVLAVLLGVNIGPNLTYTGSLATLLWRRILHQHGSAPSLKEFTILGLLTVPAGLALAVLALWAGLHALGG
jgi:arsenical pump membrane protein